MGDEKLELKMLVHCMIAMAAADSILHDKEVEVLLETYRRVVGLEIDKSDIEQAYSEYRRSGHNSINDVLGTAVGDIGSEMKDLIIKASYLIMVSDGNVVSEETEQLANIAALLNLPEDRFIQNIREMK